MKNALYRLTLKLMLYDIHLGLTGKQRSQIHSLLMKCK